MVTGFWVWILGGFSWKCTALRLGAFCTKSAPINTHMQFENACQNPHQKSAARKSPRQILTKTCAQTLNQYPQSPQRKGHKGCRLSCSSFKGWCAFLGSSPISCAARSGLAAPRTCEVCLAEASRNVQKLKLQEWAQILVCELAFYAAIPMVSPLRKKKQQSQH